MRVEKLDPRWEQWRYQEGLKNGDVWEFTVDVEDRYRDLTIRGLRAIADALEADPEA